MTLKRNKLRNAIAYSLAVGAISLAGTGAAFAQSTTPQSEQEATQLDTITVTGTRIKSQNMTAASPVTEINAEEFRFAGATIAEDLVNQFPQMSPIFDNFANNPSTGYSQIDLRGIGPQRTLTLVNGRRIPKGLAETADISIIPTALIQRVDLLTGGASAVYGSDAIAGVVNFILDDEFEGVNVNVGYSAYQHKNDNAYIQNLMRARNYEFPTGSSGFGGISKNIDLAIGGAFGEGGHAVAWATWRKNDALFQGERDYSSCALNAAGTACGGSPTADPANFYIYGSSGFGGYVARNAAGRWTNFGFSAPNIYNFAPINYYQRPDTRFTAGTSVKYELSEHVQPYIQAMFVSRRSPVQIAPSGAFFTDIEVDCRFAPIGNLCADLGIPQTDDLVILVAKRNTEGGPRYYENEAMNYSLTSGVAGAINDNWSYDASFTYGRTTTSSTGFNDFLTSRIRDALLGCPAGSFSGCVPYTVFNDTQTPEQAQALQGVSQQDWTTSMKVFTAYITGDLGMAFPWANGEPVSLVTGYEWRSERYSYVADTNFASGNFAGSGSNNPQINNGFSVKELFAEANMPIIVDAGFLNRFSAELGYRYSDYSTSGGVDTYKLGFGADMWDNRLKLRAGYNRAIRGASINELYSPQALGLWSGTDPCAGPTPLYTAEQCARTGVPAGRYGLVPANAAAQYNQIAGGNPVVAPEEADTWTAGFAITPIENLDLSVDYYDIKLSKQITTLAPRTIIDICANTGDAGFCSLIRRNPSTGDLFRSDEAFVLSSINNFGDFTIRGIDVAASYAFDLGPGRLSTNMVGTYQLEREFAPVPGGAPSTIFDCVGNISPQCQDFEWRHIANARYSLGRYTFGVRWRYYGELEYADATTGAPLTADKLVCSKSAGVPGAATCLGEGKIPAYNYFDLSSSIQLGDYTTWTIGVNNVADKEPPLVGASLVLNGNAPGGYDQAGRYFFTSFNFKF